MKPSQIVTLLISLLFALIGPLRMGKPAERGIVSSVQGIQGVWNAVSVEGRGLFVAGRLSVVIGDKTMVFRVHGKDPIEAKYTLDPKPAPSTLDLVFHGENTPGIYEVQGDTLRICLGHGKARPVTFATSETVMLLVLARKQKLADGTHLQAAFAVKALHSLSTIETISAQYTISHSSSPGVLQRYRYIRSDDGEYLEDRTRSLVNPQMESFDSDFAYHWRKIDGVVHASVMERAAGKANFELQTTPELLLGTRIFDALGMGLIDAVRDPRIVVNAEAHSVTLRGFAPQRPGGALTVEARFDPDHSFLPKVIQTTLTKSSSGEPRYLQRWEILEYFKVKDGATGASRWFPRKAVLTQGIPNSITMEVQDAAVNVKIPAKTFAPDLPAGSQVYDATKKNSL